MSHIRPTVKKSQWNLSKHEFYSAYHYALMYEDWKNTMVDIASIDTPDPEQADMPRGNGTSDTTFVKAVKISSIRDQMRIIEDTVLEADEHLAPWLLKGVTNEYYTYHQLATVDRMPCGRNYYYDKRRKFYYLLWHKLKAIRQAEDE